MLSLIERKSYTAILKCLYTAGGRRNKTMTDAVVQQSPLTYRRNTNGIQHNRTMVMITQTKATNDADDIHINPQSSSSSSPHQSPSQQPPSPSPSLSQQDVAEDLSVTVTDACYQRIHYLINQKNKKQNMKEEEEVEVEVEENGSKVQHYLRVFVDAGGCSGFTYQFELDTDTNLNPHDDVVYTEPSTKSTETAARVVIDRGSLKLLAGSKIDYVQEMIKSTFEVRENPQSESACGCGSSFAIKNFSSNPALD